MALRSLTRVRLLPQIQAMLDRGHLFIEAPAGYGKTFLLQQLAAHRPFTYYLQLNPADIAETVLLEKLQGWLEPANTILLDDVHLLGEDDTGYDWLRRQLGRGRPRLALAGRYAERDLAAQIAGGRLQALTQEHLAFSLEESRALLEDSWQRPAGELAQWHHYLEGWPLGLDLLSRLATQERVAPAARQDLFTYLARGVFEQLPAGLYRFMQLTALPLRFSDELAGALLETADARSLRDQAQRRNLYLYPEPLPGWHRYHHLIRDFLVESLTEDLRPLYWRIVAWFQERGEPAMAIEHALLGGLAADLLAALTPGYARDTGRLLTYRRWILALPETTGETRPALLLDLAGQLHLVSGRKAEAWALLRQAHALAEARQEPELLRQARRQMARLHFLETEFQPALEQLLPLLADPGLAGDERLHALRLTANCFSGLGRFRQARRYY